MFISWYILTLHRFYYVSYAAEEEARKLIPFEPLDDVDDEEIEGVILNEEEVKIKTQVWMELNKEYLQEQEGTFPFINQRC